MADFEEPCIAWRKSTASDTQGCVQVAVAGGSVLIRDSANTYGTVLELPPVAWSFFMGRARNRNFDLRLVLYSGEFQPCR